MRIILLVLVASLSLPMALSPAQAAEGDNGSVVQKTEETVKEGGQAIGNGARDATKAVGHATRKVAKKIGHGARKAAKAVGDGARDTAHGVGNAAQGVGSAAKETVGAGSGTEAGK